MPCLHIALLQPCMSSPPHSQDLDRPGITHVVVGDLLPRDAFQAPAAAPIVSEKWLKACMAAGEWLDASPFIVQLAGAHLRRAGRARAAASAGAQCLPPCQTHSR